MIDKLASYVIPLWLITALSGCGPELVGGGLGEAETVMTDEGSAESTASRATTNGPAFARMVQLSPVATGRVKADVSVALVAANGRVDAVTDGIVGGEVRIASTDSVRLGLVELMPMSYPTVRLTFGRVVASVSTGIETGLGVEVAVDLGSELLVVDVPIEVTIRERRRTTIVIDLNASTWLLQADASGLVPATAFQSALRVRVQ